MDLFINEWSFQSQFHEQRTFDRAVARLVHLIERARRAIQGKRDTIWRSDSLADVYAVRRVPLLSSMNHIGDREVLEAFKDVIFNKANPVSWESERHHQADVSYAWEREAGTHEDVCNTSMAELAERLCLDSKLHGCLLNLVGSPLAGRTRIVVIKAATTRVELWSFESEEALLPWLDKATGVVPYPADAREPPRDEQTCLRNAEIFALVPNLMVQGRHVYRHGTRRWLYYVDNEHSGGSAHLEVFDRWGRRHLGEAFLENGHLKPGTRGATKKPIR